MKPRRMTRLLNPKRPLRNPKKQRPRLKLFRPEKPHRQLKKTLVRN